MASLDKLTYPSLSKPDYQRQMDALQLALMSMQLSLFRNRQRAVLVVEGPDGAGKGGLLRRALRYMDPRSVRVHPTGAPDERERGQHYLQRFWERLPKPGQISVFDRSWYGRLLIERVENGLHDVERARREIAQFEQMLIDDGIWRAAGIPWPPAAFTGPVGVYWRSSRSPFGSIGPCCPPPPVALSPHGL